MEIEFKFLDGRKFIFNEYRGESELVESMDGYNILVMEEDITYEDFEKCYKEYIKFSNFRKKIMEIKDKKMMWELSDLKIDSDYSLGGKIFDYLMIKETNEEKILKKKLFENFYEIDNKYEFGEMVKQSEPTIKYKLADYHCALGFEDVRKKLKLFSEDFKNKNRMGKKPDIFFDYYFFEKNEEGWEWEYAINLAIGFGTYEIWKWFYEECEDEGLKITYLYGFLLFSNGENLKYLLNEHIINIEKDSLENYFLKKLRIYTNEDVIKILLEKCFMVNDSEKILYMFRSICELSDMEIMEYKERNKFSETYLINLKNFRKREYVDFFVELIVNCYFVFSFVFSSEIMKEMSTNELIYIFDWIHENYDEKIPKDKHSLTTFLFMKKNRFNWLFNKGYYDNLGEEIIKKICLKMFEIRNIDGYAVKKIYEKGLYDFKIPYEMMMKIEDEEIIKFLCEKNPGHCRSYKFMYGEYINMDLYDKYLE